MKYPKLDLIHLVNVNNYYIECIAFTTKVNNDKEVTLLPEVGGGGHLQSEGCQVDDPVGDQEEHGDNGGYGVQFAKEQGHLEDIRGQTLVHYSTGQTAWHYTLYEATPPRNAKETGK